MGEGATRSRSVGPPKKGIEGLHLDGEEELSQNPLIYPLPDTREGSKMIISLLCAHIFLGLGISGLLYGMKRRCNRPAIDAGLAFYFYFYFVMRSLVQDSVFFLGFAQDKCILHFHHDQPLSHLRSSRTAASSRASGPRSSASESPTRPRSRSRDTRGSTVRRHSHRAPTR